MINMFLLSRRVFVPFLQKQGRVPPICFDTMAKLNKLSICSPSKYGTMIGPNIYCIEIVLLPSPCTLVLYILAPASLAAMEILH